MCYRVLLVAIVLSATVSMIAQSSNETQAGGQGPGGMMTVTGCLRGEGGNYTITDKSTGLLYTLGGDRKLLAQHQNQQVTITGKRTGQSVSGGSGSMQENPTAPGVIVQNLKVVSTHTCSK